MISKLSRLCFSTLLLIVCSGNLYAEEPIRIFEDLQDMIISVSNKIKPSVVHIDVVQKMNNQRFQSLGSGLIIDEKGYILTNDHVVDNAQSITVTLESKLEYTAVIIGTDKQTDLALIKIEPPDELTIPELGDSDSAKVGEWVIAVGNPYGFDRTVSFGIISGKGRVLQLPIETPLINDFLQTDAVIDPGSSGGPLVNLRGEVIGINSIGYGRGQGFTIPINIAKDVRDELMATGAIDRGWIGVFLQPLPREYAEYFGDKDLEGILISDIAEDSPARRAGLQQKDIIVSLNGEPVSAENENDLNAFSQMISSQKVGDEIELGIIRDGDKKDVEVEVALQPKVKADEFEIEELDLIVKEITETMYRQYALETMKGVFVEFAEVGGVAGKADLQFGDVIVAVEGVGVDGLSDFKEAMKKLKDRDMILLKVIRSKTQLYALLDKRELESTSND
ncbi:MAG: PDZ domain-containing protein [candidate division Zixibacteria bacterium]|nr:PDZ domain-containing protein [candidate division Zixibacteria bacterium]